MRNTVEKNRELNRAEREAGLTTLSSYPLKIGINISNICNQQCKFCAYDKANVKTKNWLTPDLFKKMTWLEHIAQISLFAGMGDPLVNPKFPEIVKIVREIAPYSEISSFTNGLGLEKENLDAVTNYFNLIHISLNGSNKEEYDQLVLKGNFDKTMQNLTNLSRMKNDDLIVELSTVLTRGNAGGVYKLVDMCSDFGFQRLIAGHYVDVGNKDRLSSGESVKDTLNLYFDRNDVIEYANKKNVELIMPTTAKAPDVCMEPWTTAYITNDGNGERIFGLCCSGVVMNAYLSDKVYTEFMEVWNSPLLVDIRKTVNKKEKDQNNMCYICKKSDKTDKNWKEKIKGICDKRGLQTNQYGEPIAFDRDFLI